MINFDFSNWNQKQFSDFFNRKIPNPTKLGKYSLPYEIEMLSNADKNQLIDLSTVGFYFDSFLPLDYNPIDIIPFANTGGDGCFFAFLTDYQFYVSIYDCPIVFISPSDGDEMNFLFAENFKDFLRIMISIFSAEIIRFNDPKTFNFENAISQYNESFEEFGEKYFSKRQTTIEYIKDLIGQDEMRDLNQYFTNLNEKRRSKNYIFTKDNFNINFGISSETIEMKNWLINPVSETELERFLSAATSPEIKIFIRNMPYIYKYYDDNYQNLRFLVLSNLQTAFNHEKEIIANQIQSNAVSDYYLKWSKNGKKKDVQEFIAEYSLLKKSPIEFDWAKIKNEAKEFDENISIEFADEDYTKIIGNEGNIINVINFGFPFEQDSFKIDTNGENSIYCVSVTTEFSSNVEPHSYKKKMDMLIYLLFKYSSADQILNHTTSDQIDKKFFLTMFELARRFDN
ncbi:MAG: hypothetical protein U0T36_08050 [Saprospiraceae bacterium]|jgi:hypothetical protein